VGDVVGDVVGDNEEEGTGAVLVGVGTEVVGDGCPQLINNIIQNTMTAEINSDFFII
jgi:hypothetical protein